MDEWIKFFILTSLSVFFIFGVLVLGLLEAILKELKRL